LSKVVSLNNSEKLPAAKVKVLVADDAQSMRGVVKSMLKAMGFINILEAVDGTQTVKLLDKRAFQLILCDWEMPGYKGDEILKLARESGQNQDAIFIMCTGANDQELVKRAIKLGVSNFIIKPFNPKTLQEKLAPYFELKD
jgi:two-component system, chemotaxis family, chemotaxis protein CheY